jgi:D-alanine-D-alanine ligase
VATLFGQNPFHSPDAEIVYMKVLLIADIIDSEIPYPEFYKQEWESRDSIHYLQDTIQSLGYEVEILEPVKGKDYVLEKIIQDKKKYSSKSLMIFNLVEGFFSPNREAYIPSLAEFLGIPFCGSDAKAQILSLDKSLTIEIASRLGILVPESQIVYSKENVVHSIFPSFGKPQNEGSSLGVSQSSLFRSPLDLEKWLLNLPEIYLPVRIETYLSGKEYTLGVMGSSFHLECTSVARVELEEIVYSQEVKGKDAMPEKIVLEPDSPKMKQIQAESIRIAKSLGVSGYSRLDWKEDEYGNPHFLEINLTPGLSYRYSALPVIYREMGKNYSELIKLILESAWEEYRKSHFRIYGKLG